MSGPRKREPEEGVPLADDLTDADAERIAAEAERWLEDEQQKDVDKNAPEEELPPATLDEVDVKDLLRRALRPPPGTVAPSLLGGVQKKLRTRSHGKFYGDGWSTARSPRSTYLVTSVLMLVIMVFVFLVLVPWGGGALR